jgi:hypothetical protein
MVPETLYGNTVTISSHLMLNWNSREPSLKYQTCIQNITNIYPTIEALIQGYGQTYTNGEAQLATSLCKTLSRKMLSKLVPWISEHATARGIILYTSLESHKIYGKYIMCIRRVSLVSSNTTTALNVPRSDKHSTSYTRDNAQKCKLDFT